MSRYVLDSFAVLAHLLNEDGGPRVRQLIANSDHVFWMTVVNLAEVYYRAVREHDFETAKQFLRDVTDLPIEFVEVDRELALAAGRIKAGYALSYADCLAAALARANDAAVVTGDPEFAKLEDAGIARIEWLPSRPKRPTRPKRRR